MGRPLRLADPGMMGSRCEIASGRLSSGRHRARTNRLRPGANLFPGMKSAGAPWASPTAAGIFQRQASDLTATAEDHPRPAFRSYALSL